MAAKRKFLDTLRTYLLNESGNEIRVVQTPCDHDWRVFHGITGDHAKCLRCGVGGDITIRERTNR